MVRARPSAARLPPGGCLSSASTSPVGGLSHIRRALGDEEGLDVSEGRGSSAERPREARFFVDTIEGELPLDELEKMRRMLEEG